MAGRLRARAYMWEARIRVSLPPFSLTFFQLYPNPSNTVIKNLPPIFFFADAYFTASSPSVPTDALTPHSPNPPFFFHSPCQVSPTSPRQLPPKVCHRGLAVSPSAPPPSAISHLSPQPTTTTSPQPQKVFKDKSKILDLIS